MHIQKSEVGLSSYTIYKIKSKWIKSLNIRPVKLLGEEGGKFHEFECNVIIFWIWYPKYRQQKHNRQMYVYVQRCFNHVWLCVTLWTIAWQAPLSKRFSRQEYWSGLPCPLSGIFLTQGSNLCLLGLLHWQVGSLPLEPTWKSQ